MKSPLILPLAMVIAAHLPLAAADPAADTGAATSDDLVKLSIVEARGGG